MIPGGEHIRPGAKQIIDTFAMGQSHNFSKVVIIEYPRRGLYCLAFITGDTKGEIRLRMGREMTNIFLPTTPNPTSGFFLVVPNEDLLELDMSIEEGIKMIVSGGLVTPNFSGGAITAPPELVSRALKTSGKAEPAGS